MASLVTQISSLATAIANYLRDSVLPRLVPSGGTTGQYLWKTADTDGALGWITPNTASGTITSVSANLAATVALRSAHTWYNGPSVSLAAGTWLIIAKLSQVRNATTAEVIYARLTNGTTHYASAQNYHPSASGAGTHSSMSAVVTLASTTTVTAQIATSAGSTSSLLLAAMTANGAGNNASSIVAIRLA